MSVNIFADCQNALSSDPMLANSYTRAPSSAPAKKKHFNPNFKGNDTGYFFSMWVLSIRAPSLVTLNWSYCIDSSAKIKVLRGQITFLLVLRPEFFFLYFFSLWLCLRYFLYTKYPKDINCCWGYCLVVFVAFFEKENLLFCLKDLFWWWY